MQLLRNFPNFRIKFQTLPILKAFPRFFRIGMHYSDTLQNLPFCIGISTLLAIDIKINMIVQKKGGKFCKINTGWQLSLSLSLTRVTHSPCAILFHELDFLVSLIFVSRSLKRLAGVLVYIYIHAHLPSTRSLPADSTSRVPVSFSLSLSRKNSPRTKLDL